MTEDFVSIEPKNEQLAQLIDHYYFHKVDNSDRAYTVIYHPHYKTAINFYRNAEVLWDENGRIIRQLDRRNTACVFTRNVKKSRYVRIIGSVNKIGIVFKPLGINHFIKLPLSQISNEIVTNFNYFGDSFNELATDIYRETSTEQKRNILDKYFLSKYTGFKDESFKKLVLGKFQSNVDFSAQSMAAELQINRKTLLRKFKAHLCYSPSDFKAVIKFRQALNQYNSKSKLTDIAYNSNYYDQSSFIKNYKALAGLSPKQLFKSLSELGDKKTLWTKVQ